MCLLQKKVMLSMKDHAADFSEHLKRLLSLKGNESTQEYGSRLCSYEVLNASKTLNMSRDCRDNTLEAFLGQSVSNVPSTAHVFFTYFTPVIFIVGIIGNTISLIVFLSKNMRKLSASMYLVALAISDTMSLMFYVFPEWIKRSEPILSGYSFQPYFQRNGICQCVLYLQYVSRFLSSWFLVFFTIERFIGVCFPLRRKDLCDTRSASRLILGAIVVASIGCTFKPVLSGSYPTHKGYLLCTSDKDHQYLSFILDSIYGVTIAFIPFTIITILNMFIIRQLLICNKQRKMIRVVTEESVIRLEFTFILLAMSICFVALNLPYFAVWCRRYWTARKVSNTQSMMPGTLHWHDEHIDYLDNALHVTRPIFYINYCVNFFLYSVTGAFFRKELKHLFSKRNRMAQRERAHYSHRCSAYRSNLHASRQTSLLR